MAFGTDESVLFIEVSSTCPCPDREMFHCLCTWILLCTIYIHTYMHTLLYTCTLHDISTDTILGAQDHIHIHTHIIIYMYTLHDISTDTILGAQDHIHIHTHIIIYMYTLHDISTDTILGAQDHIYIYTYTHYYIHVHYMLYQPMYVSPQTLYWWHKSIQPGL